MCEQQVQVITRLSLGSSPDRPNKYQTHVKMFFRIGVKRLISFRKSGKSRKNCGFEVQGVWGVILTVNIIKRIAQKLRRIILLHFGLVTFRFHYWETRKPITFIFFGPGGRDNESQYQFFSTLETPGYSKQFRGKSRIILRNYYFGKSKKMEM